MDILAGVLAIAAAYALVAWQVLRWQRTRPDPVDPAWPHDDTPYDLLADPYLFTRPYVLVQSPVTYTPVTRGTITFGSVSCTVDHGGSPCPWDSTRT